MLIIVLTVASLIKRQWMSVLQSIVTMIWTTLSSMEGRVQSFKSRQQSVSEWVVIITR